MITARYIPLKYNYQAKSKIKIISSLFTSSICVCSKFEMHGFIIYIGNISIIIYLKYVWYSV